MKKLFRKLIPNWLLVKYKTKNKYNSRFREMNTYEVFTDIYNSNHWESTESISGTGSEIKQTESLIIELNKLLKNINATSVLDLPCGDFKWMQKVDLLKIDYIGADIVEELINMNKINYKEMKNVEFRVLNLIEDTLPKSDIIIIRDCFVHLSYENIKSAIKNIKNSGCKYLLTTTFTDYRLNYDIVTGDWRPLNLQEKPFYFSTPLLVINENCTEQNEQYNDKSMALWEISKL